MKKNRQKFSMGFTLLETIIVLSIMGVFFVSLNTSVLGLKEKRELEKQKDKIISQLNLVQQRSITAEQGTTFGLFFNSDSSYQLLENDAPEETILLEKNIIFDNFTPVKINFFKLTGTSSASLNLTLVSNKFKCGIIVDNQGLIDSTNIDKK